MWWQKTAVAASVSFAMVLGRALSFAPSGLLLPSAPGARRALGASPSASKVVVGSHFRTTSSSSSGGATWSSSVALAPLFHSGQQQRLPSQQQQQQRGFLGARGALSRGFAVGRTLALSMVAVGDVAGVEYSLRREEDSSPYEARFDQGNVRVLVGGGGFAPFLHKALMKMEPGEEKKITVPPKDAFGEYDSELTATLGMDSAPGDIALGTVLQLYTGQKATVTEITKENFKIDWNSKDAGVSLVMDVKVLNAAEANSVLKTATFAGGCFWGLELAFQRAEGVVTTKAGYCQGSVQKPTYSDVCTGKTGHTEAVQVLYHPSETTYENLLGIFFGRHNPAQEGGQGNDRGTQYRAGVYFHNDEQRETAENFFEAERLKRGLKKIATELEKAEEFFEAEEEHQQYLQKGGQDARKAAEETIRCYG